MAKNWSNLPLIFKQDVVKYLNFKDRCYLQQVSKAERDLVKTVPIYLMDIGFNYGDGGIELRCQEHPVITNGLVNIKQYISKNDMIVSRFLAIFEHPKSTVDSVNLSFFHKNSKIPSMILEWHGELQKRPDTFRIKAKNLNWYCEDSVDCFLDILNRFDTRTLKGLQLDCPIALEQLQRVIKTELVRNLESFALGSSCSNGFSVMELFIGNHIDLFLRKITPEDIWSVIKNFRSAPRPYGSYFFFFNYQPNFEIIEIEEVVKMFDEPSNNFADFQNQRTRHIQIFKMENGNGFLKVEITSQSIRGTLTEKED
ncbi:hypothetical protein CAEBREN_10596 [Caenorhabditis brenneri]|uniref:F-box domain-containing protein n=1 Tax=Caenorhabditis brenneri TaxID=135651 RepID=G0NEN5_CAEBE|nr:hypothetical protein CAEBREN_10596 [Caenorhabditis brenneri]